MKVYKLTTRFEIRAYNRRFNNGQDEAAGFFDEYTQEALNIEDNFDLTNGVSLSKVLQVLDRIHEAITEEIK